MYFRPNTINKILTGIFAAFLLTNFVISGLSSFPFLDLGHPCLRRRPGARLPAGPGPLRATQMAVGSGPDAGIDLVDSAVSEEVISASRRR